MQVNVTHWDKRRSEDPLSGMRRHELKKLCVEMGVEFDHATTTAREMRVQLRKAGYGNEDAPE